MVAAVGARIGEQGRPEVVFKVRSRGFWACVPVRDPGEDCGGWLLRDAEVALLGVIPSGEQLLEGRGCSVAGRWGYGVEEVHGQGVRARLVQRAGRRGRRGVEEGKWRGGS